MPPLHLANGHERSHLAEVCDGGVLFVGLIRDIFRFARGGARPGTTRGTRSTRSTPSASAANNERRRRHIVHLVHLVRRHAAVRGRGRASTAGPGDRTAFPGEKLGPLSPRCRAAVLSCRVPEPHERARVQQQLPNPLPLEDNCELQCRCCAGTKDSLMILKSWKT